VPVDKKILNQYRALAREIPKLKSDIDKLYERLENVPTVAGKVTKSSDEFPYIEEHIKVEMEEPKQATEIKKQIRYKELRLNKAETDKTRIEKFIASIEDSTDRQIFELTFIDGMKQKEVADIVGLERSSISKKIYNYLQLSHNSHF
jgi:DNA-directed RNA polymerase specialized sigma subunit